MTYPPSPYGQPPSPYGQPASPYGAPSPYGYPQPQPPQKKSNTLLFVILGVVALLVVCGGGGVLYWVSQKSDTGSSDAAAPPAKTDSLADRTDAELMAVLPGKQDFPVQWDVKVLSGEKSDDEGLFDSETTPDNCDAPFSQESSTTVGTVYATPPGKKSVEGHLIELARWASGDSVKLSAIDSYLQRCGSFEQTDTYRDGSEIDEGHVTISQISDLPKTSGGQLIAYQRRSTYTETYPGGRPAVSKSVSDNIYMGDVRGILVWFYCGDADKYKAKCQALFTDVVNKLNAL